MLQPTPLVVTVVVIGPLRKTFLHLQSVSRLAVFGLQIHDRMAGEFLPFADVSKAMNVVSARSGQLVFDPPNFLEHQIASTGPLEALVLHTFRRLIGRFARGWPDSFSRLRVSSNNLSKSWPYCAERVSFARHIS